MLELTISERARRFREMHLGQEPVAILQNSATSSAKYKRTQTNDVVRPKNPSPLRNELQLQAPQAELVQQNLCRSVSSKEGYNTAPLDERIPSPSKQKGLTSGKRFRYGDSYTFSTLGTPASSGPISFAPNCEVRFRDGSAQDYLSASRKRARAMVLKEHDGKRDELHRCYARKKYLRDPAYMKTVNELFEKVERLKERLDRLTAHVLWGL